MKHRASCPLGGAFMEGIVQRRCNCDLEARNAAELEATLRRQAHERERDRLARMTRWQTVDERRKA